MTISSDDDDYDVFGNRDREILELGQHKLRKTFKLYLSLDRNIPRIADYHAPHSADPREWINFFFSLTRLMEYPTELRQPDFMTTSTTTQKNSENIVISVGLVLRWNIFATWYGIGISPLQFPITTFFFPPRAPGADFFLRFLELLLLILLAATFGRCGDRPHARQLAWDRSGIWLPACLHGSPILHMNLRCCWADIIIHRWSRTVHSLTRHSRSSCQFYFFTQLGW